MTEIISALKIADQLGLAIDESQVKEFEDFIGYIEQCERQKCWDAINAAIDQGQLPGNGTDKTAERNGLVLATNIIHGLNP